MPLSRDLDTRILQLAEALAESRLSKTPDGLSKDRRVRSVQYLEALARKFGLLPPSPDDPPEPSVPTIVKSIGTSSRDYSTITGWEADLDSGAIYASGDTAQGECYNDSAFAEAVTINGGGTVGLAKRILTVASGQAHDGTSGTGARVSSTTTTITCTHGLATDISLLEVFLTGTTGAKTAMSVGASGFVYNLTRLIVKGVTTNSIINGISENHGTPLRVMNSIIYGFKTTSANVNHFARGFLGGGGASQNNLYNLTIHGTSANAAATTGLVHGTNSTAKNCIVMDSVTSGAGADDDFSGSGTVDHNLSSDATASGTGSLTSKSASNQFVSIVGGSEDFHLKTGADAIDAGTDLVTTPTGVNIDIDGRDRDAEGDTWDMGADEFVAVAAAGQPMMRRFGRIPVGIAGVRVYLKG